MNQLELETLLSEIKFKRLKLFKDYDYNLYYFDSSFCSSNFYDINEFMLNTDEFNDCIVNQTDSISDAYVMFTEAYKYLEPKTRLVLTGFKARRDKYVILCDSAKM